MHPTGALRVWTPGGAELPAVPKIQPAPGNGHVHPDGQPDGSIVSYGGEGFDLGLTIDALLSVAGRSA